MSETDDRDDRSADEVLGRADALLKRHRAAPKPVVETAAIPTLTESLPAGLDLASIPTLTDIVEPPVQTAATPPQDTPVDARVTPVEEPVDAQAGEIISRVQAQNLEHGVYQKLKQQLDTQIADVLQSRFMPDVAGALDQALNRISAELRSNIDAMVRASIEEALDKQLKQLRAPDPTPADASPAVPPASGPSAATEDANGSGIMRGFSPPAAPARMELAKSFDPRSIEDRWYPEWENRGYFAQSGDISKPAYCIQLPPPNVTGTLHMGHAFQQTLMDALVRYHRMRGDNTNWVVGTDHAGIATQIVVEQIGRAHV